MARKFMSNIDRIFFFISWRYMTQPLYTDSLSVQMGNGRTQSSNRSRKQQRGSPQLDSQLVMKIHPNHTTKSTGGPMSDRWRFRSRSRYPHRREKEGRSNASQQRIITTTQTTKIMITMIQTTRLIKAILVPQRKAGWHLFSPLDMAEAGADEGLCLRHQWEHLLLLSRQKQTKKTTTRDDPNSAGDSDGHTRVMYCI